MRKARSLFLGLFSAILLSGNAYSLNNNNENYSIFLTNKPNIGVQLAKSTFLPETYDDLGLSGHENTKYDHNKGNNCSGYELTSCPANGNCSSCPFDRKYKRLVSCTGGYTKNGNSCKASSCSAVGYESSIPANKICTKVTEGSLTCYKDCKSVSCSGYTLNCDSFNVANSAGKTTCPDCESGNANCSPKLCKVDSCLDGFKIANNGTTCVALDDNCPDGYFKECETGTQGDPQYTEKGTACWQCKPKSVPSVKILYSDLTTSTEVISGKTPIGVVFDEEKKLAVALQGSSRIQWSTTTFDISDLTNFTSDIESKADWNGKNNTKMIINYCKANSKSCPAAEYANTYTSAGTSAGDWYLPAEGELNAIYNAKAKINTIMAQISGTALVENWHWSSSEYSTYSTWVENFYNGLTYSDSKGNSYYVRPVINYGDVKQVQALPILYSDLTTSTEIIAGKTPIGVVFDEDKKLAVALNSAGKAWSKEYFDIPGLNNITSSTTVLTDWNGKKNTKAIIEYCKANSKSCPAAEYAYNYTTEGTKAGDWYLPALAELKAIYTNQTALDSVLASLNGGSVKSTIFWTSSEYSDVYAWGPYLNSGLNDFYYAKQNVVSVRPVINYGDVNNALPILYSDLTTSTEVISGKTPIGIVFDEDKKLALALNSGGNMAWSAELFDIPILTNYETKELAQEDWAGRDNTTAIITYCSANSKSCPAAEYANSYSTEGTSPGDWYLPALGELESIYSQQPAIDLSLAKVNGTAIEAWYWSSTEHYTTNTWHRRLNGITDSAPKSWDKFVRAVIDYSNVLTGMDLMCAQLSNNPEARFCGGIDPYAGNRGNYPYCLNNGSFTNYAGALNNGHTCWSCAPGEKIHCYTNSPSVSGCDTYENGKCVLCYNGTLVDGKCI